MPKPVLKDNDLISLMNENIKLLKKLDDKIIIQLKSNSEKIFLNSDKEQLSRVFFNLIKNAIESIQQKHENIRNYTGKIDIEINKLDNNINLRIVDNGIGFGIFAAKYQRYIKSIFYN
jgi:two-component system nitrogen regulation sensor histidine kinase NtrY